MTTEAAQYAVLFDALAASPMMVHAPRVVSPPDAHRVRIVSPLRKKLSDYFTQTRVSMTPTPRPRDLLDRPDTIERFPFTRPAVQTRHTFNGTVAINQLVQDLKLSPGDHVLMPAYFCGSELGPFEHAGCTLTFYNVGADLQLDIGSLRASLNDDTKAVFITHYFGFPQRSTADVAALCEMQGAALIEDCAHALYSDDASGPVGRHGTYAIFSPRKSLPLIDGGLLIAQSPLADGASWASVRPPALPVWDRLVYGLQQSARSGHDRRGALGRRLAILALTPVSIAIKLLRKVSRLSNADWATADVEGPAAIPFYSTRMSHLGHRGLAASDAEEVKARRCTNYQYWLDAIAQVDGCDALIPTLPPGVCPLYFPLVTHDPASLVTSLEDQGIEAFFWWPHRHPAIQWADYPHLDRLKNHVIALPVHQHLGTATIDRAVALIDASLRAASGTPPDA